MGYRIMATSPVESSDARRSFAGTDRVMLSPSIMCADQLCLGDEIAALTQLGVDLIHVDIMDGHYVPNFIFGIDQCRALASASTVPLDIHLMIDDPDRWAPVFAAIAGNPIVTIHPETTWHPARVLDSIRNSGAHPGIAIDPARRPEAFRNVLGMVDIVLIMTVNPGYAGQALLPWTLDSVRAARELRERYGYSYLIEVDGNVSWDNVPNMVAAGADILVTGTSSLFDRSMTRSQAVKRLNTILGRR